MELFALSQYPWEFFFASLGILSESPERMQMISEISFLDSLEVMIFDDCTGMIQHVACSVLIAISVRYEKKIYFFMTVIIHAMLNLLSLYLGLAGEVLGTAGVVYLACKIYNINNLNKKEHFDL